MYKKILVPVDGSKYADVAIDTAVNLAQRYRADIVLLHVIRNLSLPQEILDMIAAGEITASRMELLQDSAEIILSTAAERLKAAGFTRVQRETVVGGPATQILKYAQHHHIDLIVIGYRGLGPHADALLGSVARKLVNTSTISCLIAQR